ncbi:MAG: sel1 repeat family protein [Hyphomicrobiaceae bacterium]|nr:sel1 repeat family protein [Hyphomicrobiaceae bacterium]
MSHYSDNDPARGRYSEGAGARAPGPACGAGELRGLLQHIADHIAHADERQQTALLEMQARLEHLAEEAQLVRDVVPPEFAAAFARIEDGIATLTERIASGDSGHAERSGSRTWVENAGREQQPEAVDYSPTAYDGSPPQYEAAERCWSRGAAEPPPALRSAAAYCGSNGWDRDGSRPASPPLEAGVLASRAHMDEDSQWDRASADALTRVYEPEHEHAGDDFDPIRPAAVPEAAYAGPGSGRDEECEIQDPAALGSEEAAHSSHGNEPSDWLEQRFGEIAARLEQALASMPPDASVGALEARLDSFEQKMGSAFDDLATRADVEGLKLVEAHINELAEHIDLTRSRLARLDDIEAHLTRLAEQVSDERFARLIEQQALSEPGLARLAEFVAERLGEGGAYGAEAGAGADRLGELRDIVEQFVSSRRQGDEHAAGVLEAIQQAVLNLLDRLDALEHAQGYLQLGEAGEQGRAGGRDSRYGPAEVYVNMALPAAGAAGAQMAAAAGQAMEMPPPVYQEGEFEGIGAEILQARSAARDDIPAQATAADSIVGHAGAELESGHEAAPPIMQGSREDFIAAARRAARKASSQAAGEREELGRAAMRLRGAAGGRHGAGRRPVTGLVVATLAVVLAMGIGLTTYSIFKTDVKEPAAVERSGLEQGAGSRQSALVPEGEDHVQGGPAGGAGGGAVPSRATAAPGNPAPGEPGSDSVVIDDEPATPGSLPAVEESMRGRTVTGLPGGVMVESSLTTSAEDIARAHRHRAMAQLSSSLGAAQPGTAAIPAALIPQAGEGQPATGSVSGRTASSQSLPPAAVGPLSLRLAAANGEPSAEFEVAARYAEGRGIPQDLKEAVSWYQRSAARGFAPAQYRLGTHYERGLGVKADRGRAKAWYRSAAEKGNLKAMHNLAVLSASGNPADYGTAAHWFAEAAARGLGDSQFNMAVLHETGRGVDRDLVAAYKWFALAARSGDKEAARRRDQVKPRLDADQLKDAEALVSSWKPLPAAPLVNNARAAGEAWKRGEVQG